MLPGPDWSNTNPFVTYTGLPNNGQGGIGLGTRAEGGIEFDNVTLRSDPDGDATYDVLELHESFDNDGDNFRDMAPEHDASGNLTFDGLKRYTYDAFNRLVKVENAFKDPDHTPAGGSAGDLAIGSTVAAYAYDAQNRRIRKDTYIGGELDNVEHFYCIGDTLVETRNGSSQVIQQHVWHSLAPAPGIASGGGHYIDSLAEVSNNTNPGVDDTCDQRLFTLQDQQYNILALVDTSGGIVERYEYGLYGERTVMNATYVVLHESAYNINCGFQGLYHDVETGLVYNRARMLNPRLKRFNQRDPLGYPDGMNSYAAYHVLRGGVDPLGMAMAYLDANGNLTPNTSEAAPYSYTVNDTGPHGGINITTHDQRSHNSTADYENRLERAEAEHQRRLKLEIERLNQQMILDIRTKELTLADWSRFECKNASQYDDILGFNRVSGLDKFGAAITPISVVINGGEFISSSADLFGNGPSYNNVTGLLESGIGLAGDTTVTYGIATRGWVGGIRWASRSPVGR